MRHDRIATIFIYAIDCHENHLAIFGKQFFAALFLELHSDDLLALRREVGLRAGIAVRHKIADDEQSGVAVLVVGKKLTGGRAEQIAFR